jgi:glycine oxidase
VTAVVRAAHRRQVAVIGAGIIGLACAWRLTRAGHAVTVLDPAAGSGATHAAAGMIAPASEAVFGQDALLATSLASARLWPGFAAELARDVGRPVELAPRGTLLVALDADDEAALARHARHLERRRCHVERLTSRAARRLEPALSPRLTGAVRLEETAVDPRAAAVALEEAFVARGGTLLPVAAEPVVRDGLVTGVRPVGDGWSTVDAVVDADVVVVAAGWSSPLVLAALGHPVPIRPLKGQVIRLAAAADTLAHTVRATVRGREVYIVPRPGGEVVVGATSEDVGEDVSVTAGAVHDLLHDAIEVVPELAEATFREATARLRPATTDNLPLVGPTCVEGLLLASGHGRDGVLLAPLTAEAVTAHVDGRPPPRCVEPFAAQRLCPSKEHS